MDEARARVEQLVERAFEPNGPEIGHLTDVNEGRGAFSIVLRAKLTWPAPTTTTPPVAARPRSVVAKLPIPGPNGEAAAASGAYRREIFAYREVLGQTPVAHPRAWALIDGDPRTDDVDDPASPYGSLLLEDLGDRRLVDQLDGLGPRDALAVAESLARLHRTWTDRVEPLGTAVRRNTLASLSPAGLDAGLAVVEQRWTEAVGPTRRAAFAGLRAAHGALVERFGARPVTLCHGDPRADNLAFGDDGEPVLFDWQQMAVQFGAADLAWLAATSLGAETRRSIEADLVEAGGVTMADYRLGLALPGLAVLFLAQRELSSERARRFVAVSLQRIADALLDNDTVALA